MNEHAIRDDLANKLELIEPGLTLIEKEYQLRNAHGSKGFIDILAKDRYGNRVIIELKRSNAAARHAIHEIFKYVALFKEQQRVSHSQLRCIIVSTEWRELLVPFSELHRSLHVQLEGFKIDVAHDGRVTAANIVTPVESSKPTKTFRSHHVFLYETKDGRDGSLEKTSREFSRSGGLGAFILPIDCVHGGKQVVYRYATYLVPAEISAKVEELIRQEIDDEGATEFYEPDELIFAIQERFGAEMIRAVNADTYEIGYPEKFSGLFELGWRVDSIQRIGSVPDAVAADDDQVIQWIAGVDGSNSQKFEKVTSPRFHLDWEESIEARRYCLRGNEAWLSSTDEFCKRVLKELPNAAVSFQVFNPQNLPIAIFKLACHGDDRYIPTLEVLAWDENSGKAMLLIGGIKWDGITKPTSVEQSLGGDGGFFEFLLAIQQSSAWEMDPKIMRSHGFHYFSDLLTTSNGEGFLCNSGVESSNQDLPSRADGILGLHQFIDKNSGYVDELASEFLCNSSGL